MCTKLFSVPPSRRISQNCQGDRKISEAKSSGDLNSNLRPLSLPQLREEGVSLSFSLDRGDSGKFIFRVKRIVGVKWRSEAKLKIFKPAFTGERGSVFELLAG